jgi:hypothetical protein
MTKIQSVSAIAAVAISLFAAFSLYSTAACSCASAAQVNVAFHWDDADEPALGLLLTKRYPKGTQEAMLAEKMGSHYQMYCKAAESKLSTACLFPHDRNFWRTRAVELTFSWDRERRLASVIAAPRVTYRWQ